MSNSTFKTVAECAESYIKKHPDFTNKELSIKVREEMHSQTTAGCIAWYKSKLKGFTNLEEEEFVEIEKENGIVDDYDIQLLDNEAEYNFYNYIVDKVKEIKKMEPGIGYDFMVINKKDEELHVEVKSKRKGKISWLQLTSRETEAFLEDKKFHLCIIEWIEGKLAICIIDRKELFDLMKIKLHARINGLSSEIKRKKWNMENYL